MTYSVRRADPRSSPDRFAIQRLWLENLPAIPADALESRFEWLYLHNPDGQVLTWLALEGRRGAVVGCASIVPREMVVRGDTLLAGIATDFAIDRAHRSFGLALRMQRIISAQVWEEGIRLLLCSPNAASRGVFQRIGYREVGRPWRGARLLRSAPQLVRRGCPRPVARITGFGIDLALRMHNSALLLGSGGGARTALLDVPDERWKRYWSRVSSSLLFAGSRTPEYLYWRYRQCPIGRGSYFCLLDQDNELLGYLVFRRRGKVVTISDLQVLEEPLLRPLLACFWREMRDGGASVMDASLVHSGGMARFLAGTSLTTRDAEGWTGVLPSPEAAGLDLHRMLRGGSGEWYLMEDEVDL